MKILFEIIFGILGVIFGVLGAGLKKDGSKRRRREASLRSRNKSYWG